MATEKIKIKLQGHEKFALREGWINNFRFCRKIQMRLLGEMLQIYLELVVIWLNHYDIGCEPLD